MFQFPESISAEEFLELRWQKSGLFMPQALPDGLPELSADELAWLATLDDVESRLVFTERNNDQTHYRSEHGPFDEETLAALPPDNWTLLVQDVEKHLPVFRILVQEASFIPDWRIDDLMVSFAAPGGSVGPHRDNYDVFLCQGIGRKEWRIAPDDTRLKTVESAGMSLLESFADDSPIRANRGDVLYLPPGIAHWGIAEDSCMTYSLGMRAPTLADFLAGVCRIHDLEIEYDSGEERFYKDPDLSQHEAQPGLISERALERARQNFSSDIDLDDKEFAAVFGSIVTDPKAWLAPESPDESEIETFMGSDNSDVQVHGMARLAYCSVGGQDTVFVNGHAKSVSAQESKDFRGICGKRMARVNDDGLFRWLLAHGAFDLQPDGQNDAT